MDHIANIQVGHVYGQEELEDSGWHPSSYFGDSLIFSHETMNKMILWDPTTNKVTHIIPSDGRYATK